MEGQFLVKSMQVRGAFTKLTGLLLRTPDLNLRVLLPIKPFL
jgi:hypothetical protein